MKYVVVLSDGMAGRPLAELSGRTTLEAANVPAMNRLAGMSEVGTVSMIPEGMAPGSDTANLAVMGYDPNVFYTGRSPLEALSIGVDMKDTDVSFRCNLVTLSEEEEHYTDRIMLDHSSEEISTEEAEVLLDVLKEALRKDGYSFYSGTGYRHLLIWDHGEAVELTPPHDILTRKIGEYLPTDATLRQMMEKSYDILKDHPINVARRERGLRAANSAWFWGAGTRPALTPFTERTGKKGVMISAVDLLKGIAVGVGIDNITVEGANGSLHTNYKGKAQAAVKALVQDGYDFAYIHVEAPDEMGHQGHVADKIKAIEYVDGQVLEIVWEELKRAGVDHRILVLPDHPTPIEIRTHTSDPVPYILYDSTRLLDGKAKFDEKTAEEAANYLADGYQLMEHLLGDEQS